MCQHHVTVPLSSHAARTHRHRQRHRHERHDTDTNARTGRQAGRQAHTHTPSRFQPPSLLSPLTMHPSGRPPPPPSASCTHTSVPHYFQPTPHSLFPAHTALTLSDMCVEHDLIRHGHHTLHIHVCRQLAQQLSHTLALLHGTGKRKRRGQLRQGTAGQGRAGRGRKGRDRQ